MKVHANAALGPAGRLALVEAIESGMTLRAAAAALNVAPATAHRWWHRRLAATSTERESGAWLRDRSSRPRRQPRRLTSAEEEPILRGPTGDEPGPGTAGRDLSPRPLDDLEGAAPSRSLTASLRATAGESSL